MSWTPVIEQHRVVDALKRAIAGGRVAHAYLFLGPDGTGKRAVALAFARALLCELSENDPCGQCRSCRKVTKMIHPDVRVLFPHPKDASTEDIAERLALMADNPYAAIDYVRRPSLTDSSKASNKQAFYPVARIHEELHKVMSYRPVEGRYKVALLTDAHLLRTEAANALLKLLEEPSARTVFILTTSRVDQLLPTIVSRCQQLRFDLLGDDAVATALVERRGMDADEAATVARMAVGSYGRALALAENEDLRANRALVLDFFRHAFTQNIDKQADLTQHLSQLGREQLKGFLNLSLRWIRDLLLYQTLGAQATLVNVDQAAAIKRFCEHVPEADLPAMVRLVEEALELTERNVHQRLLLTVLCQGLGAAMRGGHRARLYVPLAEPDLALP